MIEALLKEKDELAPPSKTPHLSHSRINRYLLCPEQYRFYYIEKFRLKFPSASLVFGQVVHQALADLFNKKSDPIDFFLRTWGELKDVKLTYGKRQTWVKLQVSGQGLLQKFVNEELARISHVRAVEKKFELNITGLDLARSFFLVWRAHGYLSAASEKFIAIMHGGGLASLPPRRAVHSVQGRNLARA